MLSCLDPVGSLCSVVAESNMAVGRAVSGILVPEWTVIMRFVDVQWVQHVIR